MTLIYISLTLVLSKTDICLTCDFALKSDVWLYDVQLDFRDPCKPPRTLTNLASKRSHTWQLHIIADSSFLIKHAVFVVVNCRNFLLHFNMHMILCNYIWQLLINFSCIFQGISTHARPSSRLLCYNVASSC